MGQGLVLARQRLMFSGFYAVYMHDVDIMQKLACGGGDGSVTEGGDEKLAGAFFNDSCVGKIVVD